MRPRPGSANAAETWSLALAALALAGAAAASALGPAPRGSDGAADPAAPGPAPERGPDPRRDEEFEERVRPVLAARCFTCHGPDEQEGGLRLDDLDPDMVAGPDAFLWEAALDLLRSGDMPPRSAPQPSADERRVLTDWIAGELERAARATEGERRTVVRRLNRAQYTRTLQELLGLSIDFGAPLPEDGRSHMGFSNDGEVLRASALHFELFERIAREALGAAIVTGDRPEPVRYRVELGRGVGVGHVGGTTGGYQAVPLSPDDFVVHVLDGQGRPRTGADGAERAALDAIRRRVTVGLRGSSSDRFHVVEEGLVLYSALPHREVAPGAWQGPSPNVKLEMQHVFPRAGDFVLRVEASRGYLVSERKQLLVPLDEPRPLAELRPGPDGAADGGAAAAPAAFGPWYVAGPIRTGSGEEARDATFTPRSGIDFEAPLLDGTTRWRRAGDTDGLVQTYPEEVGAVLLARRIESPSARRVELSLGSDDAVWVWLRGEPVLAADVRRGVEPDQERLTLELEPGTNELLVKVVNYGGGFGSYARVLDAGAAEAAPPFEPRAPRGALVLPANRFTELDNLRFERGALVPRDVPAQSRAATVVDCPPGYWQVDLVHPAHDGAAMRSVRVTVGGLALDLRPVATPEDLGRGTAVTPLGLAYLSGGPRTISVGGPFFTGFTHLVLTPLGKDHPQVQRLEAKDEQPRFETVPAVRAFVGTRTDDGMDYAELGEAVEVEAPLGAPVVLEFRGRLENLPIPEPDAALDDELSGICVVGLWNDHLVKSRRETGPPLLVRALEFEAPVHEVWPPESHRRILHESEARGDEERYTREVLERFLPRAFRRSVTDAEVERYLGHWRALRGEFDLYEESLREALVAVLCSPHFLLLAEPDDRVDELGRVHEELLASRLSYFLWNGPPDEELLELARAGRLRDELAAQTERLLDDPRSEHFVRTFAREWLKLDRFERAAIDPNRFPDFTRFVQRDMVEEACRFFGHVLREDLPLEALIEPGFALLNQNLAEFYGVPGVEGVAFRPVPLGPGAGRGGLLRQGAFLAGHSDGREPHPIKRAVFVKERLLGQPPLPPPPNVPALDATAPDLDGLTLAERIELHRASPACHDCHAGLDPYGLALEDLDAVGRPARPRDGHPVDASTVLPDGTAVEGTAGLEAYLLGPGRAAFEASLVEHLFAYALGRTTGYGDEPELEAVRAAAREGGGSLRAVVHAVVRSPSFRDR